MSLTVAILAGGLGTRLQPLTRTMPKAMVDVNGKPFIGHQLELLADSGVNRVILCIGYLGMQICQYVGNGSQFDLQVEYSLDGPFGPLGTAGALREAAGLGDAFFVLYGDSYLPCDYGAVEDAFSHCGKLAMMTVWGNDTGNAEYADGVVTTYDKASRSMSHIDYGLSVLTRQVIAMLPRYGPYDLADLYSTLADRGQMAGYEVFEPYHSIGTQAGLLETRRWLSR